MADPRDNDLEFWRQAWREQREATGRAYWAGFREGQRKCCPLRAGNIQDIDWTLAEDERAF